MVKLSLFYHLKALGATIADIVREKVPLTGTFLGINLLLLFKLIDLF